MSVFPLRAKDSGNKEVTREMVAFSRDLHHGRVPALRRHVPQTEGEGSTVMGKENDSNSR